MSQRLTQHAAILRHGGDRCSGPLCNRRRSRATHPESFQVVRRGDRGTRATRAAAHTMPTAASTQKTARQPKDNARGTNRKRRKRPTQAARAPHDTLSARPLPGGQPTPQYAGSIGIGSRRAHSKQESHDEQLQEARAPSGQCGEGGPPGGNAGEARAAGHCGRPVRPKGSRTGHRKSA